MLTFEYQLTIGDFEILSLSEATVQSSWQELGETCTLSIGGLTETLEKNFKAGDNVRLVMGYAQEEQADQIPDFVGFVKKIQPGQPAQILCQDITYFLRQESGTYQMPKGDNLGQFLRDIVDPFILDLVGAEQFSQIEPDWSQLDSIIFDKTIIVEERSIYSFLEYIKKTFHVTIYCQQNRLYGGLLYADPAIQEQLVTYKFYENIITNDLTFQEADEILELVEAVSVEDLPDGKLKKHTAQAGNADGSKRTLHVYGVFDQLTLQQIAEEDLRRRKFTGYLGGLTSFGIPRPRFGFAAQVVDPDRPERSGKYFIDRVDISMSKGNGYRREVTLGELLINEAG